MKLMREKAHEIRGIEPPPLDRPASPKLLPIRQANAISWQGSAGASAYDVWRSESRDGDWHKIAADVSDAHVQYRPLFNDASAVPARKYYYRITAKNAARVSEPSNVVGPVRVECRTLVDECRDFSQIKSRSEAVAIVNENARTTQEDSHRLALSSGAWVVYELVDPIHRWRVSCFARDTVARLKFAVSSDGDDFQAIEADREEFAAAESAYGYLMPVLYEGQSRQGNFRFLRIAAAEITEPTAKPEVPHEIGRIVIEYARAAR
jgi:hypothetical protein